VQTLHDSDSMRLLDGLHQVPYFLDLPLLTMIDANGDVTQVILDCVCSVCLHSNVPHLAQVRLHLLDLSLREEFAAQPRLWLRPSAPRTAGDEQIPP